MAQPPAPGLRQPVGPSPGTASLVPAALGVGSPCCGRCPAPARGPRALPALLRASTSAPHPWPGSASQLLAVPWSLQLPGSRAPCQVHPSLQPCLLTAPDTPVLGSCWSCLCPLCAAASQGSRVRQGFASWAQGQAASRAWAQWAAARACSPDPPVPPCLWRAGPCCCHGHEDGALLSSGPHSGSSGHKNIDLGISQAPQAPGLAGMKVPAPHRSCGRAVLVAPWAGTVAKVIAGAGSGCIPSPREGCTGRSVPPSTASSLLGAVP